MNKIKIGLSEVSLVPEGRRVRLVGQLYERVGDKVDTPICATVMALECGDDSAVFVTCDLGGTSHKLLEKVRARLPETCDLDRSKILMNAIHTHTAFGYAGSNDRSSTSLSQLQMMKPEGVKYIKAVEDDDPSIFTPDEATELLVERISAAIVEAWENRSYGSIAFGFGRAAVGMNRRVCFDDGHAEMWGDTNSANFTELEGGNDSGIELMFTYDENKTLTGVVVNIACPAQVLEHQSFISADYIGKLRCILREKYGSQVKVIGLISPAGDLCPRDMIRWVDADIELLDPHIQREVLLPRRADPSMFDLKGCEKVARRIANEIFWALDDVTEYIEETELVHKTLTVKLPLRRVTPIEYKEAKKTIADFFKNCGGSFNYVDNAALYIHAGTMSRFELQKTTDMFDIEMHVMKLHDVAFATNPFELFLNYGNKIRARSYAKQTFLIQLSCGSFGYLPTERAERGSHYSAYITSGTTGHEGGDLLVRRTLTEINEMFSAKEDEVEVDMV